MADPTALRRLQSLCTSLLVLNLAYCTLAVFVPAMPGWKMFPGNALPSWQLRDSHGQVIHTDQYLPRFAYSIDATQAARIARFVCEKSPGRAPLTLRVADDAPLRFSPPSCKPTPPKDAAAKP